MECRLFSIVWKDEERNGKEGCKIQRTRSK